jgi:hypothetical protein
MGDLFQQRWDVLPSDWKLAFIVLILSSVILPLFWQIIKFTAGMPNRMYRRVLTKLYYARIDWFKVKGPTASPPTDDELISWAGVWPWLAKRAKKIQTEKLVTEGLDK